MCCSLIPRRAGDQEETQSPEEEGDEVDEVKTRGFFLKDYMRETEQNTMSRHWYNESFVTAFTGRRDVSFSHLANAVHVSTCVSEKRRLQRDVLVLMAMWYLSQRKEEITGHENTKQESDVLLVNLFATSALFIHFLDPASEQDIRFTFTAKLKGCQK